MNIKRQSKIGMLFIGAERFMELGDATNHGTYAERKVIECEEYLKDYEVMYISDMNNFERFMYLSIK